MAQTQQIAIDVTGGKAVVIELNNGMPVPPAKELNFSDLSVANKKKVDDAIKIIQDNAKVV